MVGSKNQYLKTRDNIFIALLLTLIIDVVCLFLHQVQGIIDFNYNLHAMLAMLVNFSIFIVPIELVMFTYYSTRYFKNIWKATMLTDLRYKVKVFTCIICLFFTITLIYYQINIVTTSLVSNVTNKTIEGNSTYIIVNSKNIKCTRNEYNLINLNEEYSISYKWNHLKPNVGKLDSIRRMTPY